MEELPQGQPTRNQKLVLKNGGFSGYCTETTTGPEQITGPPPGVSPTHSHMTSALKHFLRVSHRTLMS